MKLVCYLLLTFLSAVAFALPEKLSKRNPSSAGLSHPHVLLMHMDGTHSDVFKAMVDNGQLPHYKYLLERGKINYDNSTVDKSETMKVILSYLTSSVESEVVGWWQFNRNSFSFKNFWIDPIEVVNYALGLEFPRRPTIHDFLAAHGKTTISGFGLHRRSVSFENYSRAYFEGVTYGILNHQYLDQAQASMDGLISKYKSNAEKNIVPSFAHGLLAPADEFAHLDGLIADDLTAKPGEKFVSKCFEREKTKQTRAKGQSEIFFKQLDELQKPENSSVFFVDKFYKEGKIVQLPGKGHFSNIAKDKTTTRFCVDLPVINYTSNSAGDKKKVVTHPLYVLGMLSMDIQMGRLLNTFQSLKLKGCKGNKDICFKESSPGLEGLLKNQGKDSLFSQTLFVFSGDHGIVDSKSMMAKCEKGKCPTEHHGRGSDSVNSTFIELLNTKLNYKQEIVSATDRIGINDTNLPKFLKYPHLDEAWVKSAGLDSDVEDARKWALAFFGELRGTLKTELARQYWYLLFLKKPLVYNKLDKSLEPHKDTLLHTFENLYLKSIPKYRKLEVGFLKEKYDQHVSFVYGGGALNNAEFFFPTFKDGKPSWSSRPTYEEILSFKGNNKSRTFLEELRNLESIGVVFIRKNIPAKGSDSGRMEIAVFGEKNSEALIMVERDQATRQLVFGYKVLSQSDPLKLGELPGSVRWGTYNEWNDFSVEKQTFYHNPVAGIGSYLYSDNPAIGDILATHGHGWNFGDNAGGHGGIHADEKKTILMVSGPDLSPGKLMAKAQWQTTANGKGGYNLVRSPFETNTTVLDIAPTIINWLGYDKDALNEFGNSDLFRDHMQTWVKSQRGNIQERYAQVEDLEKIFKWASFEKINIQPLDPYIKRLFEFIPTTMPELIDTQKNPQNGNILMIEGTDG